MLRVDRTKLDVRRDDMEYYFVVAQLTGGSTIIQNDRVINAAAGETRPARFHETRDISWGQSKRNGLACSCRARTWCRISASSRKVARAVAGMGRRHAYSGQLALDPVGNVEPAVASADDYMRLVVYDLLGDCLHCPPRLAHATTISCSGASAASSRTALPILTSLRARWLPRREFPCAICRSCSRSAGRHAVTTYLRAVWIVRRV